MSKFFPSLYDFYPSIGPRFPSPLILFVIMEFLSFEVTSLAEKPFNAKKNN
ncbi:hypothetical protein [Lysinibacillus xylanilyticus]|uniref:hypothetical protein n=1 Tax=Lysinibacillus xylanilyticus TaxID=582475 RepID=UPI003CFEBA85